ncbi:MAG TPA: hypothetical protein VGK70_00640, partial [Thermoanaerobaculia bacterium]
MPDSTADEASLSFPSLELGTGAGRTFVEVPAEVGAGSPPRSAGNPASEKLDAAGQAFAIVHFGVRWEKVF